jgi:uncharacterized Fe-S cluster protein YjdI
MKEYKQGKLVITWEAEKCIHSGICARGLATVFKPKEQPWIKTDIEEDEKIIEQIKKCPSAALGYRIDE